MENKPYSTIIDTVDSTCSILAKYFDNAVFIYNPSVDWRDGIHDYHVLKERLSEYERKDNSIFLFNRSVLSTSETFRERGRQTRRIPSPDNPNKFDILATSHSTYDLRLKYIARDIYEMEVFEVLYNSVIQTEESILSKTSIGDIPYSLTWEDASEVFVQKRHQVQLTIEFSVKVSGYFFVYIGEYPRIRFIDATYRNENGLISSINLVQ